MYNNLSVKQLLQIPNFKNCKVLTADAGLDRKVSGFVVVDNLDVLDRIKGGELVCSTAGGFKDPFSLTSRMLDLLRRGVSIWALRLERSDEPIPDDVISLALAHNFPLIVFPPETRWHRVVESIMSHIQQMQNRQREQGLIIRDQLTKLVLASKGLKNIIQFLSEHVNNPVILVDRFFNAIAHAFPDNLTSPTIKNEILSLETKEHLKEHYRSEDIANEKHKYFTTEGINLAGNSYTLYMMPIYIELFFFGWLILVELKDDEAYLYPVIMEHGATVLALELQKEKKQLEALTRTKEGFFQSIVEGQDLSPQEMRKRINLLGIYLHTRFVILIIRTHPTIFFHHFQKIETALLSHDPYATLIESKEEHVAFFHPKGHLKQLNTSSEIKSVAHELADLLHNDGYSCQIGIGKCTEGYQKISSGYLEAKQALQKAIFDHLQVVDYYDLGLERLFSLFDDNTELKSFAQDILDNLLHYDQKNHSNFYNTLQCYLANNQNRSKTARDMTLHINSVNYRLQRIEEILHVDLSQSDTVMMLYFAVKVYAYLER